MEILGLPVHVLLVHLVVVLAPAMAVVAVVYAFAPRTRPALAWPLGLGALVTAGAAIVTAHFGEELERALPRTALIEAHALYGDALKYVGLVFLLATALLLLCCEERLGRVGWLRWSARLSGSRGLRLVAQAIAVVAALALLVVAVLAGHSGAAAAWTNWRSR